MSSAVAVVGLTYRGTDIQDTDSTFLEIVRGLAEVTEVRGVDIVVPAATGRVARNRVADRLGIVLQGFVRGVAGYDEADDQAAFVTARSAFRALFDPTDDPGEIVATLEDGSTQTIDARTLNIVWDQVVPTFARVSVELESVDPDWTAGS